MTDAQVDAFMAKFDAADADRSGALKFSEFQVLFAELMNNTDPAAAELYFNGIDINGDKSVAKDEFKAFAVAALNRDQEYTLKLVFRAFDKDRSNSLEAAEVKSIGRYVGRELSDEEVAAGIERYAGAGQTSLNFAQVVNLLLNVEIPPDTDPYEGKLKKTQAAASAAAATAASTAASTAAAASTDAAAAAKDNAAAAATEEKSKCCLLL